jgi:hypothetical protein
MSMGKDLVGLFGTLWWFFNLVLVVAVGKVDTPMFGSMCNLTEKKDILFFAKTRPSKKDSDCNEKSRSDTTH